MKNLSEEQGQALMKLGMDIKERQLILEKNYAQRLNQVITTQQMLSLRKAEEDFRRMIIQRLEERKRQQLMHEQMINRREELLKNKGNN
jgi:ATP-dependent Lon protease